MSSPESPDAAAARRGVAIAKLTSSSTPAPTRTVAGDGFAVSAVARRDEDVVTELRAAFATGTRPDFGTGRGRWTLGALTSTALRTGRGATSSPEASVSNGVRRRLALSPEALAAPAANMSAPEPPLLPLAPVPAFIGTTLGSTISGSSPKNVSH